MCVVLTMFEYSVYIVAVLLLHRPMYLTLILTVPTIRRRLTDTLQTGGQRHGRNGGKTSVGMDVRQLVCDA